MPRVAKRSNSDNGIVAETVNLTKIYKIGQISVPALDGVSVKIERGELVSIVGPSGSGKSTLLNLLGTLDKPTQGNVLIDGIDASKMGHDELASLRNQKIGFVFQTYNLINRSTVLRNVELPAMVNGVAANTRQRRALELLKLMGIGDMGDRKPTSLSGGQQQRVALARALVNDPAIILADEPTGNLDSKTGDEIFRLLSSLCKERDATIVVVTHNLELAERTDRIIRLRDGRIEKSSV